MHVETMADLAKEEYVLLQGQLREARAGLTRLEWACGLGVVVSFSWLFMTAGSYVGYQGLMWLVPMAFPVYGCLKAWSIHARMKLVERYLVQLSVDDGTPARMRWAGYFARERSPVVRAVVFAAWALFLAATVWASMAGFADFRDQCPGRLRDACMQDDGSEAPETPARHTTHATHHFGVMMPTISSVLSLAQS